MLDEYLLLLPVVMATEFKGRGDTVELAVKDIYEGMYLKLSDIIASGCNNGEFKSELPPRSLATMIVALTDGLLLEIYRQTSGVSFNFFDQNMRDVFHLDMIPKNLRI